MSTSIQILRRMTGGSGSPAEAGHLEGELAANLADANKPELYVFGGNSTTGTAPSNKGWIKINMGGVSAGTTAPTSPSKGDSWINTSPGVPVLNVYDGTHWQPVGAIPTPATSAPSNPVQGQLWSDITGGSGNVNLKAWDGVKWVTINAAVTTQSVDLTAHNSAADIGAAYTAAGTPSITGSIVIATWGSPAQAYVLTTKSAPGTASSWTSLGGAVAFADATEIAAGTLTTKAISPKILRGETLNAPSTGTTAQAADANKIVRLNAKGQINTAFLDLPPVLALKGTKDINTNPAQAAPTSPTEGDIYIVSSDGTLTDSSWGTGVQNVPLTAGDMIIYTSQGWEAVKHDTSVNAVMRAGANTLADDQTMTWAVPTAAGMVTRLDGGDATKAQIKNFNLLNCTLDGGTF